MEESGPGAPAQHPDRRGAPRRRLCELRQHLASPTTSSRSRSRGSTTRSRRATSRSRRRPREHVDEVREGAARRAPGLVVEVRDGPRDPEPARSAAARGLASSADRGAVRRALEPARARGGARGGRRRRLRRDLVPRRRGRLRAAAERVRRADPGADRRSASPATTTSSCSGRSRSSPSPARPATAATWTSGVLDDAARAFLDSLQPQAVADDAELFHGSPLDPVWDYVLDEARPSGASTRPRLRSSSSATATSRSSSSTTATGCSARRRAWPGRRSSSTGRAGSSIPARSASRATATRGPPGSRLTKPPAGQPSAGPTIRSSGRRAEMRERGLPELLAREARARRLDRPRRRGATWQS